MQEGAAFPMMQLIFEGYFHQLTIYSFEVPRQGAFNEYPQLYMLPKSEISSLSPSSVVCVGPRVGNHEDRFSATQLVMTLAHLLINIDTPRKSLRNWSTIII